MITVKNKNGESFTGWLFKASEEKHDFILYRYFRNPLHFDKNDINFVIEDGVDKTSFFTELYM